MRPAAWFFCGHVSPSGRMTCRLPFAHILPFSDREAYRYHVGHALNGSRRVWREWRAR